MRFQQVALTTISLIGRLYSTGTILALVINPPCFRAHMSTLAINPRFTPFQQVALTTISLIGRLYSTGTILALVINPPCFRAHMSTLAISRLYFRGRMSTLAINRRFYLLRPLQIVQQIKS